MLKTKKNKHTSPRTKSAEDKEKRKQKRSSL
jgi:hypothetical protein